MEPSKEGIPLLMFIGTRPEVIKLYPVIKALEHSPKFALKIVSTSQQGYLLKQALTDYRITPNIELPYNSSADLSESLSSLIAQTSAAISTFKPFGVIIQGDTSSAFAGSISGFLSQKKVIHVEAGLRSGNRMRPFPEEIYRQAISRFTKYHFAPTQEACENLKREGILDKDIFVVGNTIVDAVRIQLEELKYSGFSMSLRGRKFKLLVTLHRRENFDGAIGQICQGVLRFFQSKENIEVVVVLHSNPKSRDLITKLLSHENGIRLVEPLGHGQFLELLMESNCVLTDSGGVQEEAYLLRKKLLIARNETERPEVFLGNSRTIMSTEIAVIDALNTAFKEINGRAPGELDNVSGMPTELGDGHSATKIVEILESLV